MEENVQVVTPKAPPPSHAGHRTTRLLLRGAAAPARRARRLHTLAILVVMALFGFGIYWSIPFFLKRERPPRTLAVRKRPVASMLHEIGSVSAHIERPVLTRFGGEITWRAEDGMLVEAGEPVVMFDSKTLQDDIDQREKDLGDKQDAVHLAEAAIDITRKKYEYLIRQKEIDLAKAELDRKKAFEFPRPDDLLDVELTWKSADLDTRLAQIQTDAMDSLTRQGFNSEAALRKQQLALANAKVESARSKMIYDITKQGTTPDLKRVAELAVADARKSLNVAIFNREADLATGQATLDLAKLALEDFERDLMRRKQRLDAATVRAPMRGRVIFQSIWKGSDKNRAPIQVGDTRPEGGDLCTLLDTSHLVISLWINEMDIAAVRLGQRAKIFLPALTDRSFDAEVGEISVTAQDKNIALSPLALRRSGEAFVNVVRVKLNFLNLSEEVKNHIRVGFTADVRLNLGAADNLLSIPWQAVGYLQDGTAFADVLIDGILERRPLKLGRSDTEHVEILSGLSDGMKVVDRSNASIPTREDDPKKEALQPELESGKQV